MPLKSTAIERGCPRCWTPIPLALLASETKVYCGACALEFEARVFLPPARPQAVQPPDAAAVAAAHCARHPRNAALAACDKCGAFICSLCRVDNAGETICTSCFDKLSAASGNVMGNGYRSFHSLSVALVLVGFFVWPIDLLIGPLAFAAAMKARSQLRELGEEITVWNEAWLIVISSLQTLAGMAFVIELLSKKS